MRRKKRGKVRTELAIPGVLQRGPGRVHGEPSQTEDRQQRRQPPRVATLGGARAVLPEGCSCCSRHFTIRFEREKKAPHASKWNRGCQFFACIFFLIPNDEIGLGFRQCAEAVTGKEQNGNSENADVVVSRTNEFRHRFCFQRAATIPEADPGLAQPASIAALDRAGDARWLRVSSRQKYAPDYRRQRTQLSLRRVCAARNRRLAVSCPG